MRDINHWPLLKLSNNYLFCEIRARCIIFLYVVLYRTEYTEEIFSNKSGFSQKPGGWRLGDISIGAIERDFRGLVSQNQEYLSEIRKLLKF